MNIDEKLGITSNTNINHREKYGKIVKLIGLDNFKELMPEEPDVLAE